MLTSRDPCIRDHSLAHLHITFISLDLRIPTSQNYHIHIHCCTHIPPYIHTCPETPTFLYPYIRISLFSYPYYSYIPIPTCPYLSLNSYTPTSMELRTWPGGVCEMNEKPITQYWKIDVGCEAGAKRIDHCQNKNDCGT